MSGCSGSAASSGPAIPYRTASGTLAAKIDLNRCKVDKLASIPGVGRRTAEDVLKYRAEHKCFLHVSELWRVPGMNERLYGALTTNVYADGSPNKGSRRAARRTRRRCSGGGAAASGAGGRTSPSGGAQQRQQPSAAASAASQASQRGGEGVKERHVVEKSVSISHSSVTTQSRRYRVEKALGVGDASATAAAGAAVGAPAVASLAARTVSEMVQPLIVRTSESASEVTLRYPLLNQRSGMPLAITVKLKPVRPLPAAAGGGGGQSSSQQQQPTAAAERKKAKTLAELGTDAVAKVGRSLSDALSRISGGSRSKRSARKELDSQRQTPNASRAPGIEGWLTDVNEATRLSLPVAATHGEGRDLSASSVPEHAAGDTASELSSKSVVSSSEVPDHHQQRPSRRRRKTGLGARASDSLVLRRKAQRQQREDRRSSERRRSRSRRRSAERGRRRRKTEGASSYCSVM